MKKRLILVAAVIGALVSGCQVKQTEEPKMQLSKQKMTSICELATLKCYYHNVASYYEKDAEGTLFWKKDKHFWIEYDGYVEAGIDGTKLSLVVDDSAGVVTITIPEATILTDPQVDSQSLTSDSYYVDSTSAAITQEDETKAFKKAQEALREQAEGDTTLLSQAQANAQTVLQKYVDSVGEQLGKKYDVVFKMEDNSPIMETTVSTTEAS